VPRLGTLKAYAEHAHAFEPERTALALDVTHARASGVETHLGSGPFAFSRQRHREVVLDNEVDLLAFVGDVLVKAPTQKVARSDVQDYVRQRLASSDEEWVIYAASPTAKSWVKKLRPALEP